MKKKPAKKPVKKPAKPKKPPGEIYGSLDNVDWDSDALILHVDIGKGIELLYLEMSPALCDILIEHAQDCKRWIENNEDE